MPSVANSWGKSWNGDGYFNVLRGQNLCRMEETVCFAQPQLDTVASSQQSHALPNACTSCGRCAEVCPADIPLPDLLRDLRQEENRQKLSAPRWRYGLKLHAWLARHPTLYHALTAGIIPLLHLLGRSRGSFSRLPLAGGWTSQRDFPAPQRKTFMQLYKEKMKQSDEQ